MPRNPPTFLTLPLELRLEIYTHLLVLPPPPPPETLQVTYRCSFAASPSSSSSLTKSNSKPTLHPQILRVNTQTYYEALPILYSQNTFSAHPVHLTAQPTLYHPYCAPCRPVATPLGTNYGSGSAGRKSPPLAVTNPNINLIRKWHLRVRVDDGPSPSPSTTTPPPPHHPTTTTDQPEESSSSQTTTTTTTTTTRQTGAQPASEDGGTPTPPTATATAFTDADSLTLELWHHHHASSTHPGGGGGGVGSVEALRPFEDVRGVRRVRIVGAVAGIEGYVAWLKGRMMRRSESGLAAGEGGGGFRRGRGA